jgi:hypothetical protein
VKQEARLAASADLAEEEVEVLVEVVVEVVADILL